MSNKRTSTHAAICEIAYAMCDWMSQRTTNVVAYLFVAASLMLVACGQWHMPLSTLIGITVSGGLRLFVCELGWHSWKLDMYGKKCISCARRRFDDEKILRSINAGKSIEG